VGDGPIGVPGSVAGDRGGELVANGVLVALLGIPTLAARLGNVGDRGTGRGTVTAGALGKSRGEALSIGGVFV